MILKTLSTLLVDCQQEVGRIWCWSAGGGQQTTSVGLEVSIHVRVSSRKKIFFFFFFFFWGGGGGGSF